MTAQVFKADVKPRTAYSLEKQYGGIKLDATAVSALAAVTTANTVEDVLGYLNRLVGANLVTTVNSTGKATSVQN